MWSVLDSKGCCEHNVERNHDCARTHKQALEIARRLMDPSKTAMSLLNLGDAYWGCHGYGQAISTYQEAVDRASGAFYDDALDIALIGRGIVQWSIGAFQDARRSIAAGIALARDLNYTWDICYGCIYQSNLEASLGDMGKAITTNIEALRLAGDVRSGYLAGLASAYLCWKTEISTPGSTENSARIEEALQTCREYGTIGVEQL
nr:tetratricopeptide repeat protein [Actinomycetota bacterium]